jgi:hypothetical protein
VSPAPVVREVRSGARRTRWIALVLVILSVAITASWMAMKRMMRVEPTTVAELARGRTGRIEIALEVTGTRADATCDATMLEPDDAGGTAYHRTRWALHVGIDARTQVVMGQRSDLHTGAVAIARGTVQGDDIIDVDRIVVLTGQVTVR